MCPTVYTCTKSRQPFLENGYSELCLKIYWRVGDVRWIHWDISVFISTWEIMEIIIFSWTKMDTALTLGKTIPSKIIWLYAWVY
jgi:hypothetical protein